MSKKQHKQVVHNQTCPQPDARIKRINCGICMIANAIVTSLVLAQYLAFYSTFIGRSNPDEEVCKHTPRSADPV